MDFGFAIKGFVFASVECRCHANFVETDCSSYRDGSQVKREWMDFLGENRCLDLSRGEVIHSFVLIIGVDRDHRLGFFLPLSLFLTVLSFFECFIRFLGFSYIIVILPEWKWPLLPLDQKFLLPLSLLLSSALCPNL